MSKEKEPFLDWESKHSAPKVTAQMPSPRAIKDMKMMSKNTDDDFMSAMLQAASDMVTIRTMGFSFDQAQSISLKIEDARQLAKWILEHTE